MRHTLFAARQEVAEQLCRIQSQGVGKPSCSLCAKPGISPPGVKMHGLYKPLGDACGHLALGREQHQAPGYLHPEIFQKNQDIRGLETRQRLIGKQVSTQTRLTFELECAMA